MKAKDRVELSPNGEVVDAQLSQLTPQSFASRPKLAVEVTRYLREAILTGELPEGQSLRITDLSSRLQVSTMPIREALVALRSEGLVDELPRRGYRVSSVRRLDLSGVFEVHAFTAGLLAERAAETITDDQIEALRATQLQAEKAAKIRHPSSRIAAIEEANFVFHHVVNDAPDAVGLRWLLRAASRYVPRRFSRVLGEDLQRATLSEHPPIIEALSGRDGRLARRLMEDHIRASGQAVIKHLPNNIP
jgi:DNA-binding GntR family transcriptional regulator